LTEPSSFINIARRVVSDEDYAMDQALAGLATRTMAIMGSHDHVVSNDLASSAMKQLCGNSVFKVILTGSGHYIHDLQYHYFRWLLSEFLVNSQPPPDTARIQVEQLSPRNANGSELAEAESRAIAAGAGRTLAGPA